MGISGRKHKFIVVDDKGAEFKFASISGLNRVLGTFKFRYGSEDDNPKTYSTRELPQTLVFRRLSLNTTVELDGDIFYTNYSKNATNPNAETATIPSLSIELLEANDAAGGKTYMATDCVVTSISDDDLDSMSMDEPLFETITVEVQKLDVNIADNGSSDS